MRGAPRHENKMYMHRLYCVHHPPLTRLRTRDKMMHFGAVQENLNNLGGFLSSPSLFPIVRRYDSSSHLHCIIIELREHNYIKESNKNNYYDPNRGGLGGMPWPAIGGRYFCQSTAQGLLSSILVPGSEGIKALKALKARVATST
jgi:hypothetical protein